MTMKGYKRLILLTAFLGLNLEKVVVVVEANDDESYNNSSEERTCSSPGSGSGSCKKEEDAKANATRSSRSTAQAYKIPTYKPTCQYYMAPSSIVGAGFGIYTTEPISKSSYLTEVPDAPSIVCTDTDVHAADKEFIWNHEDYIWDGTGAGEFEGLSVSESVMTFGSLCNYHTYLHNVKPLSPEYDDTITPRASGSPGVGAYSYHPGYHFKATRDIKSGEEIFANYGDEWLDGRTGYANSVPRAEDYTTAGKILATTMKHLGGSPDLNDSVLATIHTVASHFDKRAGSILPKDLNQLDKIMKDIQDVQDDKSDAEDADDTTEWEDKLSRNIADGTVIQRSVNWIRTEGICLDNLVSQISTLPDAGRGAFAQRFIGKGEVVVPAPLLQIMDYSTLFMFDLDIDEDGNLFRVDKEEVVPSGMQMFYNYCFSHGETSMLMCPQTNAILLNHCSTRRSYGGDCERYNRNEDSNKRGPNAKVRWATSWDPDTSKWLNLSLDNIKTLVASRKRGLSLEIIATREIQPGEEVFIDYGEGWEDEWDEHVNRYQPFNVDNYIPTKELNELEVLRIPDELEDTPYPENAQLTCIYWPSENEMIEDEDGTYEIQDEYDWIGDGSEYIESHPDYLEYGWLWSCEVVERDDENNTYTVELFSKKGSGTLWSVSGISRLLTNYARESIFFVNEPYQSDQHLLGAFRSYIRIPDDIFPEHWKDMMPVGEEEEEEE